MGKANLILMLIVLGVGITIGVFLSGESARRTQREMKLAHEEEKLATQKQISDLESELADAGRVRTKEAAEKKQLEDTLAGEKTRREGAESRAKQLEYTNRRLQETVALAERKAKEEAPAALPAAPVTLSAPAPRKMVRCPVCTGGKLVPCTKCKLEGKVLVVHECPTCHGQKAVCGNCNGVGNVVCTPCRGTGLNLDAYGNPCPQRIGPFVYTNCRLCGGTGRVKCPAARCEKGFNVCEKCHNRGKITVQEPCPDCTGKGRVSCTRCEGTGEVLADPQ